MIADKTINELHDELIDVLEQYWNQYYEFVVLKARKRFTVSYDIFNIINKIGISLLESWGYEDAENISINFSCNYVNFYAPRAERITVYKKDKNVIEVTFDGNVLSMGENSTFKEDYNILVRLLNTLNDTLDAHHRFTIRNHKHDGSWYIKYANPTATVRELMAQYDVIYDGLEDVMTYVNMDEALTEAFDEVMYEVAQEFQIFNAELVVDVVGPLVYGYDCDIEDLPNIQFDYFTIIYNGREQKYRLYWSQGKLKAALVTQSFHVPQNFIDTLCAAFTEAALEIYNLFTKAMKEYGY